MPLYLFLSGAGTGKSRNATEFHNAAIECLDKEEDSELRNKIQNALVFNVSFEDSTILSQEETDPYMAVGTRMLLQLRPKQLNDIDEITSTYEAPSPWEVLKLVAKNKKQDLTDITVFLVVDGLQHIIDGPKKDGLDQKTIFYQTISNIADLGCQGVFLIPCCTASITGPIDYLVKASYQKRVYLPVPSLHPPTIRQNNTGKSIKVFQQDYITKILVEDCGGHGRALETLQEILKNHDINKCNLDLLMNDLRYALSDRYIDAFNLSKTEAQFIARAILNRHPLNIDEIIPEINKTPDEITRHGLIQFEPTSPVSKTGYLIAPYIWIWILAQQIGVDGLLKDWQFSDYKKQASKLDSGSPPDARLWQKFEHFVATFRRLKSRVIKEGELTTISEVHAGARLNGDIKFINHHLELGIASNQEPIYSNHLNSLRLDLLQKPSTLNKVHQYKLWNNKPVSQKVYQSE